MYKKGKNPALKETLNFFDTKLYFYFKNPSNNLKNRLPNSVKISSYYPLNWLRKNPSKDVMTGPGWAGSSRISFIWLKKTQFLLYKPYQENPYFPRQCVGEITTMTVKRIFRLRARFASLRVARERTNIVILCTIAVCRPKK